jgi:hypothetical protein
MARRLPVQYPGAIDHFMARGNGRQDIVRDEKAVSFALNCMLGNESETVSIGIACLDKT